MIQKYKIFLIYTNMKHLKKFFELFDTDDLRDQNEIDFLRGKFKNTGSKIDINFEKESIGKLVSKLSRYHYPFFSAFEGQDGRLPEFDGFEIYVNYIEEEDFYVMVAESEDFSVAFGVKTSKVNSYDVFIYFQDKKNPDDASKNPGAEYENLTYDQLVPIIKEVYIQFLMFAGFEELIGYNIDDLSINN